MKNTAVRKTEKMQRKTAFTNAELRDGTLM